MQKKEIKKNLRIIFKSVFITTIFSLSLLFTAGDYGYNNNKKNAYLTNRTRNFKRDKHNNYIKNEKNQFQQKKDVIFFDQDEEIDVIIQFKKSPVLKELKEEIKQEIKKQLDRRKSAGKKLKVSKKIENKLLKNINKNLLSLDEDKVSFLSDFNKIRIKFKKDKKVKINKVFKYTFNGLSVKIKRYEISELKKLDYIKNIYIDKKFTIRDENNNFDFLSSVGIDQIKAYALHNLGYNGEGITVGVIDSGVNYNHPDLGGGFGAGHKVIDGYDFGSNDDDPMDEYGHGTHVAGIIAADGTIQGIAPKANLIAYKVEDDDHYIKDSYIIAAIERSWDPDQDPATNDVVDIINLSLGGYGSPDDTVSQAIDTAVDAGVICVISAGNNDSNFSIDSPGNAEKAITVGSVDSTDKVSDFSSKGPNTKNYSIKPEIVAPGENIESTYLGTQNINKSGTSMASPHVAGACALLLDKFNDAEPGSKPAYLEVNPENIKNIIMNYADYLDSEDVYSQGAGRINVEKASSPSTIVSPGIISFGRDDSYLSSFVDNKSITIKNVTDTTADYNLSLEPSNLPLGITVSIDQNFFTLGPNQSQIVDISLTVDNSIVDDVLPNMDKNEYAYQGKIIVESLNNLSSPVLVPFAFFKSKQLDLLFDEIPVFVYVHDTIDDYWHNYPVSNNLKIPLDEEYIDIVVQYNDGTLIIKENLLVESDQIVINKNEALYKMQLITRDENNIDIQANKMLRAIKFNDEVIMNLKSTLPSQEFYTNSFSDKYTIEWVLYKEIDLTKSYQFNGFLKGVPDNPENNIYIFENQGGDLKQINYSFAGFDESIDELYVSNGIYPETYGWYQMSSYPDISNFLPLHKPFQQTAFIMPAPYDNFELKKHTKDIFKYGANFKLSNESHLYYSSLLEVSQDGSISAYNGGTKMYHNISREYKGGLGPLYFNGDFWNEELSIYSWGGFKDLSGGDNVKDKEPYELYHNDTLIASESIDNYADGWLGVYDVDEAGIYTLKTKNNNSIVNNLIGQTSASATFDTRKNDKNPPIIKYLNIEQNGNTVNIVDNSSDYKLKFGIDDFNSGVNEINVYYRSDGIWQPLSYEKDNTIYNGYFVNMPSFTASQYISIKLEITDYDSNALVLEQNPSFFYKAVDNNEYKAFSEHVEVEKNRSKDIILKGYDPQGVILNYTITNFPQNGSIQGTAPNLTYTPNTDYTGSDEISFYINNGQQSSNIATITIDVKNVNKPPIFEGIAKYTINEGETVTFTVNASDPENDPLEYSVDSATLPYGASFDSTTREFSWATDENDFGYRIIVFNVTDGTNDVSQQYKIHVLENNRYFDLNLYDRVITAGEELDYWAYLNIIYDLYDPDNEITVTFNGLPEGAAVTREYIGGWKINWSPTESDVGEYIINCTAEDQKGLIDQDSFVIEVIGNGPSIGVDPGNISLKMDPDSSEDIVVFIRNRGTETLYLSSAITGNPEWISFVSFPSYVSSGAGSYARINFDSSGLSKGEYTCDIEINHNVSYKISPLVIPCKLTVNELKLLSSLSLTLDFGEVDLNTSSNKTITFTNDGNTNVTISSIISDSNVFTCSTRMPLIIPAYGTNTADVIFTPDTSGTYTGTISIESDASDNPFINIMFTGEGVDLIKHLSSFLSTFDFGEVNLNTSSNKTVSFTNDGNADVMISSITSDSNVFACSTSMPLIIPANGSGTAELVFTPDTSGTHTVTINVESDADDNPLINIKLTGEGVIITKLLTSLSSGVDFGKLDIIYTSAVFYVDFINSGNADVTISSITSDSNVFACRTAMPLIIPANGRKSAEFVFTPDDVAVYTGIMGIESDADDNPFITIPLTGERESIKLLSTSNFSLDFDIAPLNTSAYKTVTFSNYGNTDTTILSITSDSNLFACLTAMPLIIPANGTRTAEVVFTPDALGAHTGTISIESDADNNSIITIALTGEGIAPIKHLSSSSSRLDFGKVDQNKSSYRTITFTNDGNTDTTISSITSDSNLFVCPTAMPLVIQANGTGTAEVIFTPDALGTHTGTISVESDADYNPIITIALTGEEVIVNTIENYTWEDSDTTSTAFYQWTDISSDGTLLSISNSLDRYSNIPLSFNFQYYDQSYSSIYVCTNGFITVGSGNSSYYNRDIPSTLAPKGLIAGFWDDLYPGRRGNIYTKDFGDHIIVQWDNVRRFGNETYVTFQIVLHSDGSIYFYYKNMSGTLNSATIGIQNITRDKGISIAYNTNYVRNEFGVRIIPIP